MAMGALTLDVRKLAALDVAFHGARFIVAEFASGVVLGGGLGLLLLVAGLRLLSRGLTWQLLLGVALLWIGLNYVPLLIHALDLARRDTAREEVRAELADLQLVRTYSWRQLWILVPFAIITLDLVQRSRR
jgi:hypothetical protein